MSTGLEMLMKTFGINPDEIKASVEGFKALVLRLATAVERVENQNRAIMAHLGVTENAPGHVGHSDSVDNAGHASNGTGKPPGTVVIAPGE